MQTFFAILNYTVLLKRTRPSIETKQVKSKQNNKLILIEKQNKNVCF